MTPARTKAIVLATRESEFQRRHDAWAKAYKAVKKGVEMAERYERNHFSLEHEEVMPLYWFRDYETKELHCKYRVNIGQYSVAERTMSGYATVKLYARFK